MAMRYLLFIALSACSLITSDPYLGPTVFFSRDILPITSTVCIKCHNQPGKNWSVYYDAYAHRNEIYEWVWVTRSMPLGTTMSEEQRMLFRDWVRGGAAK